jgi:hypothetical protein
MGTKLRGNTVAVVVGKPVADGVGVEGVLIRVG